MNQQNIRKAIIDTSVLFDSLLMNYIAQVNNEDSITKYAENIFKSNITFYSKYKDFINNIECFITTSHVIGEINGLFNSRIKKDGEIRINFWKNAISFLKSKNLDERLIELIPLYHNIKYDDFINSIGYIDTGLIELAKSEIGIPIITLDSRTLAPKAREQAVEVLVIKEFIWSWNKY